MTQNPPQMVSAEIAGEMLSGTAVDAIKIDVEGMELDVLDGLRPTLTAQKPALLVEVGHDRRAEFDARIDALGYEIAENVRRLRFNSNSVLRPKTG